MAEVANLPPTALITFGAVLAVIFAVRYLGLFQGQSTSPEKSAAAAQVAAVIVDPTALNNATAALQADTAERINARKSFERGVEAVCRSIDKHGEKLDDLREEMIRRGR